MGVSPVQAAARFDGGRLGGGRVQVAADGAVGDSEPPGDVGGHVRVPGPEPGHGGGRSGPARCPGLYPPDWPGRVRGGVAAVSAGQLS